MKQQITKEQWDELTAEQKHVFLKHTKSYRPWFYKDGQDAPPCPNIGFLIEFLGALDEVTYINVGDVGLCDELWEDVKRKLINL